MTARRKAGEREERALRESVEEVWLAGLGALALAEEKGTRVFSTLMKRGERMEHRLVRRGTEVERTLERTIERRRDGVRAQVEALAGDTVARVNRGVDDAMTRVLHRIGVPTAQEVAALTKRVEALRTTLAKAEKPAPARKAPRTRRHAAARHAANRRLPVPIADTPPLAVPIEPVGADV